MYFKNLNSVKNSNFTSLKSQQEILYCLVEKCLFEFIARKDSQSISFCPRFLLLQAVPVSSTQVNTLLWLVNTDNTVLSLVSLVHKPPEEAEQAGLNILAKLRNKKALWAENSWKTIHNLTLEFSCFFSYFLLITYFFVEECRIFTRGDRISRSVILYSI